MSIGKKGSLARRIAAATGALALGIAGLAGAALTANATPGAGNIVAGQSTSLTINKYAGPEGAVGDGTATPPDSSTHTPLAGVEFTITPVTAKGSQHLNANAIDTDPAAWNLISGPDGKTPLVASDVASVDPATNAITAKNGFVIDTANHTVVTTDANGVGKLADGTVPTLPHGLYLVTETGHGDNNIVSQSAPFLVTLPLPQGNGGWLYGVNVYPKNQLLEGPTKTINDTEDQTGVKVGETVKYTISQKVPALNAGESYTDAVIYDSLDNAELKYDSRELLTNSGTALTEGVDYTFSHEVTTTDTPAKNIENVKWTLTPAGLGKIKAGDKITIVFNAKVLKVTTTGEIANGPGNGEPGTPGYGSTFNHKTTPGTTTPYTYWGNLRVTKVDEGSHPLAGAEFSVYEGDCPAGGVQPTNPTTVATGTSGSDGIVKWNVTDPTTGAAGTNGVLGLFVANSNDGQKTGISKNYCVYETKAPAGFISGGSQTATITPGVVWTAKNDLAVINVQQNHPKLPLTGAAGTAVMTLGGIALMAAGGAAYAASRRKQSAR